MKFSADKFEMFKNRLTKVNKHLQKTARKQNISCFRIYNHDLPEFPFIIEQYENKIYASEYKRNHSMTEEAHRYWLRESIKVMTEVLNTTPENIFVKTRQRKAGREGQYQKTGESNNEFIVQENGLKFIINLTDYLDSGLFLDHRNTRKMLMDQSLDKKVLNLFAYTGSFSVYAAAGGASEVTTIDLSNTYINRAKRNMQLNGYDDENRFKYITADVIKTLGKLEHSSFDLIILDPPTFSNSSKMDGILDIQQHHAALINDCLNLLSPNGLIYFSNNFTKFFMEEEKINSSSIKNITKATTPFDFDGKLNRHCYLIKNIPKEKSAPQE